MRIALIQGHPDPAPERFLRSLERSYARGALEAGHDLRTIDVAQLEFPLLRTKRDWDRAPLPAGLEKAREVVKWAEHVVILHPLWLGEMPALLKGFLEQLLRPGFAMHALEDGKRWERLLEGRSARLVVTMGMPAAIYRWYFGAHGLKNLKRNILAFCGFGPIHATLVGSVEGLSARQRQRWLDELRELGRRAS